MYLPFSHAEDVIDISTGEYPPYYSQSYKHYGVIPRIVTEAFALEGIKVRWMFMPWERAMLSARVLQVDATCCWAKSRERSKLYSFSEAVQTQEYVLFHLKDFEFKWNRVADLKDIPIAATRGYSYGDEFESAEKARKIFVQRVPSDEMGLRMLRSGRVKLMANTRVAGYQLIDEVFGLPESVLFTHDDKPIHVYQIHLVFAKKHEEQEYLLGVFNRGLNKLIDSGRFEQFYLESARGDYASE